jgi:hypothetical protein
MSSLSCDADRFVVRRALDSLPVRTLVVPLPFVRADSERMCRTARARVEFRTLVARTRYVLQLPQAYGTPRSESFAAAGRFILDRAHVLVAVWDGTSSQDDDPTGTLVALARQSEIPIAWVHSRRLSDDGQAVTFERL